MALAGGGGHNIDRYAVWNSVNSLWHCIISITKNRHSWNVLYQSYFLSTLIISTTYCYKISIRPSQRYYITYYIQHIQIQYTLLLRADKSLYISQSSIGTHPTPPSTLVYFLKAFCISFTMYHSIFINHSSIIIQHYHSSVLSHHLVTWSWELNQTLDLRPVWKFKFVRCGRVEKFRKAWYTTAEGPWPDEKCSLGEIPKDHLVEKFWVSEKDLCVR